MDIHGYSAHILVNGRKVKEYRHNGYTFVEAKDGTEFAIEVKNHLSNRVLAIVSVDGLDILDGKPATKKSRGYVVHGNNSDTFHGWRKSDTEVGAFKFTTSEQSYATEKGKGQSNGVIAVKLLAEKQHRHIGVTCSDVNVPWTLPTPKPRYGDKIRGGLIHAHAQGQFYSKTSAQGYSGTTAKSSRVLYDNQALYVGPSASYSATTESKPAEAAFDMGTTWGTKREDKVVTTEFLYGDEIATLEFYYASREALKAMGIPLVNQREVSMPQAFEGSSYAQPPKNWRA